MVFDPNDFDDDDELLNELEELLDDDDDEDGEERNPVDEDEEDDEEDDEDDEEDEEEDEEDEEDDDGYDYFDDDEEDEDDDEEDDDDADISWSPAEYPIKEWIEKKLDADFERWFKLDLTTGGTPIFVTELTTAQVLESIPYQFLGLEKSHTYYLDCRDGHVLLFFDDRPKESLVKPQAYAESIEKKVDHISEVLSRNWVVAVNIIDDDNATRIAWVMSIPED